MDGAVFYEDINGILVQHKISCFFWAPLLHTFVTHIANEELNNSHQEYTSLVWKNINWR